MNQFGKIFVRRVERCFFELAEGQREIAELAGAERCNITVSAAMRLMPNLVGEYLSCHSDIKLQLLQITAQTESTKQLLSGEVDLCVSTLPLENPDIHCEALITEEIFLVVPQAHPVARNAQVRLADIAAEPLICYTNEMDLQEIINGFFQQIGLSPNIAFACPNAELVCRLVQSGLGVAMIPAFSWQLINPEGVACIRIEEPSCARTIWLSWIKERYLPQAAYTFRQYAINYFARIKNLAPIKK